MKVVDIADELFREVGEDSNYSIASVSYWVRANIGRLNSHLYTFFEINSSYEISQKTDTKNDNSLVEAEITVDEAAILKKMFLIYYYDRTIRTNITNAGTDTIVQVTDQGSTVRKINKNEVIKSLTSLKRQEYQEMKDLIRDYRAHQVKPRQVVGDDTIKGTHGGDQQFIRTEVNTLS
ncbi:MAG: hypothetical protein CMN79_01165 [Spirochaetales bacterium]|jgi:hypothetical protein|nr:hypothetical protein [Spirochaetales bacterium]